MKKKKKKKALPFLGRSDINAFSIQQIQVTRRASRESDKHETTAITLKPIFFFFQKERKREKYDGVYEIWNTQ